MKICFVTDTVFNLGGIQRVLSVLSSELAEYHDICILCTDDKYKINRNLYNLNEKVNIKFEEDLVNKNFILKIYLKLLKILNIKTGIFNREKFVNKLAKVYYPLKIQNNLIKYLNSNKYDIVIGVAGYYSLLLGIISDQLAAKIIGWQHNSYEAYLKNKGRYHWNQDVLFEKYISRLDKYLVLTEHDKNMFFYENKIESSVMYNPRSFSSNEKCDVRKKQFLAAGRFNYQKGFDLLINSFYEFSKMDSDWNLVIVGEGEEKNKILKLIEKYNLKNRISIENFTDNIKEYFLNSSVLLLPSRWEGMPMIVLESLEMGVPIISYDIGAIEGLVDNGQEGLIVKQFDTLDFAKAMGKISSSYELRYEFSKKAIKKSEKFNVKNIIEQWLVLLNNIE